LTAPSPYASRYTCRAAPDSMRPSISRHPSQLGAAHQPLPVTHWPQDITTRQTQWQHLKCSNAVTGRPHAPPCKPRSTAFSVGGTGSTGGSQYPCGLALPPVPLKSGGSREQTAQKQGDQQQKGHVFHIVAGYLPAPHLPAMQQKHFAALQFM
jgi:hypothetical protein